MIQYATTLEMVGSHPLVGVAPGHWSVHYPRYSTPGDPNYQPAALVPTTSTPRSDWLGVAAERGVPALGCLILLGWLAVREGLRTASSCAALGLQRVALLGTVTMLGVLGTLDSVLSTPVAAFLAAAIVGAMLPRGRPWLRVDLTPRVRTAVLLAVACTGALLTSYSSRQAVAAAIYDRATTSRALNSAVRIAPGDYLARVLLARALIEEERCDSAVAQLHVARSLFPTAEVLDQLQQRCAVSGPP
jgi:hypothetical protein